MKKIFFLPVLFLYTITYSQKKIICKKGDIKSAGNLVAEYDGKGGWFKLFNLGVFVPGTKDTLLKITEISFDPQNPLFDANTFYKLAFNSLEKSTIYIKGLPDTRLIEKSILGLAFNDTLSFLIQGGKLNATAIQELT